MTCPVRDVYKRQIKGLLCHKSEQAVCLPLQGGQVIGLGRLFCLFLPFDRSTDGNCTRAFFFERICGFCIRNAPTVCFQAAGPVSYTHPKKRGVQKGKEYAILTDEISRAWSGMTTGQYKRLKGLTKENLRDKMTDLELVLTMLCLLYTSRCV